MTPGLWLCGAVFTFSMVFAKGEELSLRMILLVVFAWPVLLGITVGVVVREWRAANNAAKDRKGSDERV